MISMIAGSWTSAGFAARIGSTTDGLPASAGPIPAAGKIARYTGRSAPKFVFDPMIAPGTGSPEPSGITFRECKEAVRRLSHLDIVGFDLVEVSPPFDLSGLTSILAACLVRECLLHWWS